jgi:hypothetical protein
MSGLPVPAGVEGAKSLWEPALAGRTERKQCGLKNGGCHNRSLKEGERLREDERRPRENGHPGALRKDLRIQGRDSQG